jgi:NADH-quinone oxidoreductase subunit J
VVRDVFFWIFAVAAVFTGWRIFRTDDMVRAAYYLFASFVAVALILLQLESNFLGVILILMMAGEMVIMAIFMSTFMANPAGFGGMTMIHQHRRSAIAGFLGFAVLSALALVVDWPERSGSPPPDVTALIGQGMMGPKMMVFISAGFALEVTMIASIAMALKRGRYDRYGDRLERKRALDPPASEGSP